MFSLEATGLCGLLILVTISRITYLLFLHPLSNCPGPIIGRITDWYSVYHAWIGDRHVDFYKLHMKYGEIVRYGPNRVSVNNASAVSAIYGNQANTQKAKFYNVHNHFFQFPSVETVINKNAHTVKRNVLAKCLTEQRMSSMEQSMLRILDDFSSSLVDPPHDNEVSEWSRPHDVAKLFARLSFDIMGDICFGKDFETTSKNYNRHLIEVISDGAHGLTVVGHMPWLLKIGLHRLCFSHLMNGLDKYKIYSQHLAEESLRKSHEETSDCIFNNMIEDQRGMERQMEFPELISEGSLLIVAGSETVATTLTNTIFHLLNNPKTLSRLAKEVRSEFSNVNDIVCGRTLGSCPYLQACIDEALRISPPVGAVLPREILAGGQVVCDRYFPPGTDIGVPIYALHHNAAYYKDPFNYDPGRWLQGGGTSLLEVDEARLAFNAFSHGRRSCVGKRLAYKELNVILARLVWLYDMQMIRNGASLLDHGLSASQISRHRDASSIDKFVLSVQGPLVSFRRHLPTEITLPA